MLLKLERRVDKETVDNTTRKSSFRPNFLFRLFHPFRSFPSTLACTILLSPFPFNQRCPFTFPPCATLKRTLSLSSSSILVPHLFLNLSASTHTRNSFLPHDAHATLLRELDGGRNSRKSLVRFFALRLLLSSVASPHPLSLLRSSAPSNNTLIFRLSISPEHSSSSSPLPSPSPPPSFLPSARLPPVSIDLLLFRRSHILSLFVPPPLFFFLFFVCSLHGVTLSLCLNRICFT